MIKLWYMTKQIIFLIATLVTLGVFAWTMRKIFQYFALTKAAFPIKDIGKRIELTLKVAVGQTKILRKPLIGMIHALVWWGFIVILVGSIEMIIDGISGTERVLSFMGPVYNFLIAAGDIFGLVILIAILIFLVRRNFITVERFEGVEMKKISHQDANVALGLIGLLMLSLLGMNLFYQANELAHGNEVLGSYPVTAILVPYVQNMNTHLWHEINWWAHILLIFIFANVLPYSKHFHVFMSVPNVFLSKLKPLGYIDNMNSITQEVKMMMDPNAPAPELDENAEIERFGMKDVEDGTWKNYLDSLACTQCGRCTSVCPANLTGKLLSPRKLMIDFRARMKEKGPELVKDKAFDDGKSLLRDYISEEEIWACTLCNACAQECPINMNHPDIIVGLRRYLVMEEAAAPAELNGIFQNIENNGAPWQFSPEDRMNWAQDIYIEK
jgi:heterodisulfide reductase subunit C/nitrate reductase gamma subunit